jgi:flagellar hook-associated protein 1 FlgK
VNPALVEDESLIPHMTQNGLVDYDLGAALEAVWDDSSFTLNPSDTTPCTFTEFYTKMVGELATLGSVYSTTSESLQNTTDTIDTNRQAVIGVSSDEELTNMIKYQAAYNAASRYINVVSEMIDYLLSSL